MGYLRFWRRIKVAPGLTLNLSKSGGSLSFGPRGAKYTVGPRGRRVTVGLPGTGLFYTTYSTGSSRRGSHRECLGQATRSTGRHRTATVSPFPSVSVKDRLTLGFFKRLITPAEEEAFVDGCRELSQGNEATAPRYLKRSVHLADGAFLAGFLTLKAGRAKESIPLLLTAEQKSLQLGQYFNKYGIAATMGLPITSELTAYIGPNIQGVLLALVEAYQRAQEWGKAYECLQRLRKLEPNDVVILLSLVELLMEANYGNEETCRYVVKLTKNIQNESQVHTVLLLYKARALRGLGMNDAAKDILTSALLRKKDRSQDLMLALRYERALAYEALDQAHRARTDFEKIYAKDPEFEDIANRLRA